ncbi:unnamed protein product, partial [marine sediment metagenome]
MHKCLNPVDVLAIMTGGFERYIWAKRLQVWQR